MGSRMLANELMVAAERSMQIAVAERGWLAAQAHAARPCRPSTGALLRQNAGRFLVNGGNFLRHASDRVAAAGLSLAGQTEAPSN